jgi:ribose transport system substrate-binding protein
MTFGKRYSLAEAAAKEFDVDINISYPKNENDIDRQIELVNDAIKRKVDAIVLAACDYNRLVPAAEAAVDAGIPVIIIDSALNSSKISCFIATDNREAGRLLGQKLVELIGPKCNVVMISFVKGSATADQREEGFLSVMKEHPDVNVLTKYYCFSDPILSKELTKRAIEQYSKIDAVVALNAPSTVGAANEVNEMNLGGKIKVLGIDSTPEEIDYMENGIIQSTIVQNPYSMGYLGIKFALDVINNKKVPEFINTGLKEIDKGNIYTPENQKILFPFVN